uniref:CARD domain-containing protein n=1 Tax=Caenorhabditis japonica TaxID=281687 RepID=A0A8R1IBR1_CAEJA
MLVEIECRALNAAHEMLVQDFEPRDALNYLDPLGIFTEDNTDLIINMSTRLERIANFLRGYRRHATELGPLIGFFEQNKQHHIADFLNDYIQLGIEDPDYLREFVISTVFQRQMLDRKLLLGNVPKFMSTYSRDGFVERVVKELEDLCDLGSFFLFLHGRAGSGKSVIAAQALATSDKLIGVNYSSVVWLKDGGTTPRETFHLFCDVLLMLKSEDNLINFPSLENVSSVVLKRMIANALIDRPNTLFVFDDVVQEETIRWAQELRLRCLVTIRDLEITNVASPPCEFIEVTPLEPDECNNLLEAYGMPTPSDRSEEEILSKAIELTSGSPAVLMMLFKSCEPRTFEKMSKLNDKLEKRGLAAVECITPYSFKSFPVALKRCVDLLTDEDRSALGFAVVMPPGVDIPLKIWSCVIPVDICSNEEETLDEEVADRLKRLSKRGAFLSGKRAPVLTYKIDSLIHILLKHVVDLPTIRLGLSMLEKGLQELSNNNLPSTERAPPSAVYSPRRRSTDLYLAEDVIRPENYAKFMKVHAQFYDTLRNFVS